MIDTTTFMLGNLWSIFLPTKTKIFISSTFLIKKGFLLRYKLQLLIKMLPLTLLEVENLIVCTALFSTNFQQNLDRSEAVRFDLCLNDIL